MDENLLNRDRVWNRIKWYIFLVLFLFVLVILMLLVLITSNFMILSRLNTPTV